MESLAQDIKTQVLQAHFQNLLRCQPIRNACRLSRIRKPPASVWTRSSPFCFSLRKYGPFTVNPRPPADQSRKKRLKNRQKNLMPVCFPCHMPPSLSYSVKGSVPPLSFSDLHFRFISRRFISSNEIRCPHSEHRKKHILNSMSPSAYASPISKS